MKSAIEQLRISLGILETNEPIHRAEGDTAQADLEAANAAEFRRAISILENTQAMVASGDLAILDLTTLERWNEWREYLTPKPTAEVSKPKETYTEHEVKSLLCDACRLGIPDTVCDDKITHHVNGAKIMCLAAEWRLLPKKPPAP